MARNIVNRGMVSVATLDDIKRVAPSVFAERPSVVTSSKYEFIPTSAIVDEMMANGWEPKAAAQQRVNLKTERGQARDGFQKHFLRFTLSEQMANVPAEIRPDVLVITSHDASSTVRVMIGLFRTVCSNGLIVSESTLQSIRIRHQGHALDVVEASYDMLNSVPKVVSQINSWKNRLMTAQEQLAFAVEAFTARFGEERAELQARCGVEADSIAHDVLKARRNQDTGSDLWSVFNRAQENLTRGYVKYLAITDNGEQTKYRKGRAIISPLADVKFQRDLWNLARGYAYFNN